MVKVTYKTIDGYDHISAMGYDSFPESWGDFADSVNDNYGQTVIDTNPQLVELDEQWLCDAYKIDNRDVPEGGSIADMIEVYELSMMDAACYGAYRYGCDEYLFDVNKYLDYYRERLKAAGEDD